MSAPSTTTEANTRAEASLAADIAALDVAFYKQGWRNEKKLVNMLLDMVRMRDDEIALLKEGNERLRITADVAYEEFAKLFAEVHGEQSAGIEEEGEDDEDEGEDEAEEGNEAATDSDEEDDDEEDDEYEDAEEGDDESFGARKDCQGR